MKRKFSVLLLALCLPIISAFAQNDKKQNSKSIRNKSIVQTVKSPYSAAVSGNNAVVSKKNCNAQAVDANLNPLHSANNDRAYNANYNSVMPAHRTCGTMEHLQMQMDQDPTLQSRMEQEEINLDKWINANLDYLNNNKAVITIPVVVHIINSTANNASWTTRVQEELTVLNADFGNTNADGVNTPAAFQSLRGNTQLQFCLATRKPDGTATDGIDRKVVASSVTFSQDDGVKSASTGGLDAWDPTQYFNIWVCNLGGGLLGYAQFASSGINSTYGVVILDASFGLNAAGAPYDKGRTASHEIGHCFNLYHIWGDANCGNDNIADTPTQQAANSGCPTYPHVTCSNGPNGDMFMNYMDYVDDGCMNMFTTLQAQKVYATIAQSLPGYATSTGCSGGTLSVTTSATPTTICKGSSVTLGATPNGGTSYSYSWASTPAGFTSTAQNPVVSPTVTTTYKVTVTSSPNTATSSVVVTVNATPTASAGSNISINQGSSTTLTATGGGTYHWSSGQNTATATVTPLTTTTYLVTVTSTAGCTATSSVVVTVIPGTGTPVANFVGTPTTIAVGGTVTFTDQSTNTPTSWSWNFGDGGTSIVQNPTHVYTVAGTYTVALTATNTSGNNTASKNNYITVTTGQPAGCDTITAPTFALACGDSLVAYKLSAPQSGYVTGNNSYGDFEKAEKLTITGSGTVSKVLCSVNAKANANSGNTFVKLYAVDSTTKGPGTLLGMSTAVTMASIAATGLTAYNFTTPVNVSNAFFASVVLPTQTGDTLIVYSTKTTCNTIDSLSWELWNDNSWWSFVSPSNYGINFDLAIFPIVCTSTAAAPVANFIGSPTSVTTGGTVTFTDQSTNTPTSWSWNFGDGGTSIVQNPTHVYTVAGTYTVALTATNATGSNTATKIDYIIVTQGGTAPIADFAGTPITGQAPLTVVYSDLSTNTPTSWSWTFGDGGAATIQNPTHIYNAAGTYTVALTATNATGSNTATKQAYIVVSAVVQPGGCDNWTSEATGFTTASRGLEMIKVVDANNVWATAYNGNGTGSTYTQEYTRTINGGTSWTPGKINNQTAYSIANITATSGNSAWAALFDTSNGGGEIMFTNDGGTTWAQQTTAAYSITNASWLDFVHFFDANNGVAVGDPINNYWEIYTTTNAGTTWTRVVSGNIPAPLNASEYGYTGVFSAYGNNIWFGTNKGRIYKSIDKGLHWTVATTGEANISKVSFRDANNGLIVNRVGNPVTAVNTRKTADGGTTWTTVTRTGIFYMADLAPVGTNKWISIGSQFPTATGIGSYGYSFSTDDGATWANGNDSIQLTCVSFFDASTGWAGGFTVDTLTDGAFKWTACTNTLTANAIATPATICAGTSAQLDVAVSGGTTYTYAWSSAPAGFTSQVQNPTVTPTLTTTYTVTATSGANTATSSVAINVTAAPTANAGIDQTICSGQPATITATGGGTYSWTSSPAGYTSTIASNSVLPALTTTYTVIVTSSACTSSDAVVVTVNALPTADAGADQTICSGQPATITATGGGTYSWTSSPAGFISTNASNTVSPTATTTYTVNVTSSGCTASDAMVVSVASSVTANAGLDQSICSGTSATLTASGASTYSWSNGGNTAVISISPAITTTYTVTASSGSCTASDAVVVSVIPLPNANAGADVTITSGQSTTLTATGGSTYSWSNGGNTANITVSPTVTTTYTVTVTNTNGCTAIDAVAVTVNSSGNAPIADFAGTPITGQAPLNIAFADLSTNTPTSWSWSFGDGGTSIVQNPTHVYTVAGTYTVALTATNTTGSNTATKIDYIIVTFGGASNCDTTAAPTFALPCGDSLALYKNSNGYITGNNSYGDLEKAEKFNIAGSGTISTVLARLNPKASANNGNTFMKIYAVDQTTLGPGVLIATSNTVTMSAVNAAGYTSYTFSTPVNVSNSFVASVVLPTQTGDTLVVYSTKTSCTTPDSLSWELWNDNTWWAFMNPGDYGSTFNPDLAIFPIVCTQVGQISVIVSASPTSICAGTSVVLNANATGGSNYTYSWASNPVGFTSNLQSPTVTPTITTTYSVTVTSASNTATASAVEVVNSVPVIPTITANGNTLSSSATSGNQWYFNGVVIAGATNQTYIPTQNGNYQVMTVNANGCVSALSTQFNVTFVGISSVELSNFNIYPNPTTGMLNVVIPENQLNSVITVYSVIGEVIQKITVDNNAQHILKINLVDNSKGLYFINVKSEKNTHTWRISLIGNN